MTVSLMFLSCMAVFILCVGSHNSLNNAGTTADVGFLPLFQLVSGLRFQASRFTSRRQINQELARLKAQQAEKAAAKENQERALEDQRAAENEKFSPYDDLELYKRLQTRSLARVGVELGVCFPDSMVAKIVCGDHKEEKTSERNGEEQACSQPENESGNSELSTISTSPLDASRAVLENENHYENFELVTVAGQLVADLWAEQEEREDKSHVMFGRNSEAWDWRLFRENLFLGEIEKALECLFSGEYDELFRKKTLNLRNKWISTMESRNTWIGSLSKVGKLCHRETGRWYWTMGTGRWENCVTGNCKSNLKAHEKKWFWDQILKAVPTHEFEYQEFWVWSVFNVLEKITLTNWKK